MWDFINQPISTPGMVVIAVILLLAIYIPVQMEHKKSKSGAQRYLAEHPDAAVLYLYGEDLPSNGAEIQCARGTASSLFEAKYIPQSKVDKGMACYVLPGAVEFNGEIKWTKSYYVARKHGSMSARFTFEAEPGRSYAAVFNTEVASAKIVHLD